MAEESKAGGVAAGGVGVNASEQEERLNWYRFTRILLDVIYPLLRRVFKDRFKQKYGIAWEDEKAESKILGTQTVGANPCGLFVHGGVIGDYDKSLPGEFELKEGGDELRTTEDLTALLEDGMFIRVGPDFAFTVRKSTARTPSVQPPKDHGAHGRSPGKVMLTRKHDGPAYKGNTATYASVFVPPLAKRNGSAVDNHIRRWIEAGASDKFEMTALNNILIGTAGCVMDPANAVDPIFGNDVDDAEFWARVAGTSATGIPITGERIVQRLVIMRNGMMAHAAAARMPRIPDFDFVQRLSELAVNYFSPKLKGHTANDLADELKVILGENPGEDEFMRRTEAFMDEVQAWQEWCKADAEAARGERAAIAKGVGESKGAAEGAEEAAHQTSEFLKEKALIEADREEKEAAAKQEAADKLRRLASGEKLGPVPARLSSVLSSSSTSSSTSSPSASSSPNARSESKVGSAPSPAGDVAARE